MPNATGIRQRHGRSCQGGRCQCPWEASAYSRRDGKKIRVQRRTRAEAIAWRDDARSAMRRRDTKAPTVAELAASPLPDSLGKLTVGQAANMLGLSLEEFISRMAPRLRTRRVPLALRLSVYERDGFRCRHCGSTADLTIDHVEPDGSYGADNLQTLCRPCNSRKGDR